MASSTLLRLPHSLPRRQNSVSSLILPPEFQTYMSRWLQDMSSWKIELNMTLTSFLKLPYYICSLNIPIPKNSTTNASIVQVRN